MASILEWLQNLQSICQSGLAYSKDSFDQQRFRAIQEITVAMLSDLTGLKDDAARPIFFEDKGYRTPKLDVRAAIFQDNKILLVKEKSDDLWTLPGGWVDVGESPRQAVEREAREETGLVVRATKLAAVHDINVHQPGQFYHTYKLIFICEAEGGQLGISEETSEASYFAANALPKLSWRRTSQSQLDLCFRHQKDPGLVTEFD